jgi:hypothetical protein
VAVRKGARPPTAQSRSGEDAAASVALIDEAPGSAACVLAQVFAKFVRAAAGDEHDPAADLGPAIAGAS